MRSLFEHAVRRGRGGRPEASAEAASDAGTGDPAVGGAAGRKAPEPAKPSASRTSPRGKASPAPTRKSTPAEGAATRDETDGVTRRAAAGEDPPTTDDAAGTGEVDGGGPPRDPEEVPDPEARPRRAEDTSDPGETEDVAEAGKTERPSSTGDGENAPDAGDTEGVSDAGDTEGVSDAGDTGDDADVSDDGEAGGGEGGGSRRASRSGKVPAALAVATVLLGCLAAWSGTEANRLRDASGARNAALTDVAGTSDVKGAVTDAVNAIFSFDYADMARTEQEAGRVLTGKAVGQYDAMVAQVRAQAAKQKLVLTTTVTDGAVELLDGRRARLLLFADQRSTRTAAKATTYAAAMLAVDAVRQGGTWKISAIDTWTAPR